MPELFLALLPILALLVLMVFLRQPAIKAMPVAWIIGVAIGFFYWKMPGTVVFASIVKGILIAFEICLIVFGAIFLLEFLKGCRYLRNIENLLKGISADKRVQAIIIAWSFGVFLEGAAGFGAPAALAAPLLAGIGFEPLTAVLVSLIANSTPVSFGAIGTPVIIGLGTSIENPSRIFLENVSVYIALIHSVIGLFIPLLISCVVTRLGKEKSFLKGLEIWKFALLSGLSFVVPYFLIAVFFGPEFPSLLGGLIGLAIVITCAKKGLFLSEKPKSNSKSSLKRLLPALLPYVLATFFLLTAKIIPVDYMLKKISFGFENLFGTGIGYYIFPLLSPGIIFVFSTLIVFFSYRHKTQVISEITKKAFLRTISVFIALAFTVSLVQVMLFSGKNDSGMQSIPIVIAQSAASLGTLVFVIVSPFIGMLGSFIASSNTVSNLLFGAFQQNTALELGLPVLVILALQTVGGAVGNMIAIHNIIASSASVGLKNAEGRIVSFNIVPALVYALLAGIIGIVIIVLGKFM